MARPRAPGSLSRWRLPSCVSGDGAVRGIPHFVSRHLRGLAAQLLGRVPDCGRPQQKPLPGASPFQGRGGSGRTRAPAGAHFALESTVWPRPRGDAPEGKSEMPSCPLTLRSVGVRPSEPGCASFPNTAGQRRQTRFVARKSSAFANPAG